MVIGVLALQGAFIEHEKMIESLGVDCIEVRQKEDLENIDGIILPGGESTVQGLLLKEYDMLEPLRDKINNGLPVFATCAGLILLSHEIEGESSPYLDTLPVKIKRNAYGRQLGSFVINKKFKNVGELPLIFIRAPYISKIDNDVEVLIENDGNPVAVQYNNQIAMAFHPELSDKNYLHRYFIEQIVTPSLKLAV
ncbi:MAG: pyridoxal 5'-phosphate synthase glutaminase subunit PdxT [Lachnobacterium sp.]|nr:pyridoxal 5'-phosphate synthase glutaminase subunit PdxT [Lachnobacterium sp.]